MHRSSNETVKGAQVCHKTRRGATAKIGSQRNLDTQACQATKRKLASERVAFMDARSSKEEDEELSKGKNGAHRCNRTSKERTWELERLGVHAS